jgi:transcriptional accessory protein Tex/SPT6
VAVLSLDLQRGRIALSMKSGAGTGAPRSGEKTSGQAKASGKKPKDDKKPARFANNPFYDAFSKK